MGARLNAIQTLQKMNEYCIITQEIHYKVSSSDIFRNIQQQPNYDFL